MRRSTANRMVVLLLAASLVLVSMAKLLTGWRPEYWVPAWRYHGLVAGELAAAACLYGGLKWRVRVARTVVWVVGFALLGTVVSGDVGRCGCLGELAELGNLERIGLLILLGMLALLVLWTVVEDRAVDAEPQCTG